jgi:hypothetical protein
MRECGRLWFVDLTGRNLRRLQMINGEVQNARPSGPFAPLFVRTRVNRVYPQSYRLRTIPCYRCARAELHPIEPASAVKGPKGSSSHTPTPATAPSPLCPPALSGRHSHSGTIRKASSSDHVSGRSQHEKSKSRILSCYVCTDHQFVPNTTIVLLLHLQRRHTLPALHG